MSAGTSYKLVLKTGNELWVDAVNGVNATAVPGRADRPYLTITAAMAAASAGQTVNVRPGTYNEQVQLVADVSLHFEIGATINYTGTGSVFLEPVVEGQVKITGNGRFYKTGANTGHIFRVEADNHIDVWAEDIKMTPSSTQTNGANYSTVYISGGYLKIVSHSLEGVGCTCLYWNNSGDWDFVNERMTSSGVGVTTIRVVGDDNALFAQGWLQTIRLQSAPTERVLFVDGDMAGSEGQSRDIYIRCQSIFGCVDSSPDAGLWELNIDCPGQIIPSYTDGQIGSSGGRAVVLIGGAATQVIGIQANAIVAGGTDPTVRINASGLVSASTFRVGAIYNETGTALRLDDGSMPLDIDDIQSGGICVDANGGTFDLWAKRIRNTSNAVGIDISSGTLRASQCHINTATNNKRGCVVSGGTLVLDNCTIISGTAESVYAASAQTIVSYNSFCGTAKHANVTVNGSLTQAAYVV